MRRTKTQIEYKKFLDEPKKEDETRSLALKPGVVHVIHLNEDVKNYFETIFYPVQDTYSKPEVNALLAAQDELSELEDVCISGPAADEVLTWDAVNSCWKNAPSGGGSSLDQSFDEGVLEESITTFWHLLKKLVKIEDAWTGVPNIDEGVLT